jgi:4-diphosphocytidyl-2C-methyl-D-erythritol kinase
MALRGHTLAGVRAQLSNALEPAAERVFPALAEFRACLEAEAPGAFRLAGSGSSCFGFFADARAAEAVVARVETAAQGRRFALRSRWIGPARSLAQVPRDSRSH